jgi:hypothetical protein
MHSTAFQNLIHAWEYLQGWFVDDIHSKNGGIIQHSGWEAGLITVHSPLHHFACDLRHSMQYTHL